MKQAILTVLRKMHLDTLFRYLNRNKVLILAYHGVTRKNYKIPPWTQIPCKVFDKQIRYISERYNVVSLKQVVDAMPSGAELPKNPAVITFDDGYKNNYTAALPILQKYRLPATIFVTPGYVDSENILPLDEAYLIVIKAKNSNPISLPEIDLGPLFFETERDLLESYQRLVERLKYTPRKLQAEYLDILRELLGRHDVGNTAHLREDFRLLSWDDVRAMLETGLVDIGAHTLSHQILTLLRPDEAAKEIVESKSIIQEHIRRDVSLFAYPNGTEADYNDLHIDCLRKHGFICSLTTEPKLNSLNDSTYRLGRICVGPDLVEDLNHFSLNVSGCIPILKALGNHGHV